MIDLDKETIKDKKIKNLFEQIEALISQLEQYVVHNFETEESLKLKHKIETGLKTIKNIIRNEEKFYKKELFPYLSKTKQKKEIKKIKLLNKDKQKIINNLISDINKLITNPDESIINKINSLLKQMEWVLNEEIKEDEKIKSS